MFRIQADVFLVAYLIPQPDLENRSILLCPSFRNLRMIISQLQQTSKQWLARNLRYSLNLRYVGAEEYSICEVCYDQRGRYDDWEGHCER